MSIKELHAGCDVARLVESLGCDFISQDNPKECNYRQQDNDAAYQPSAIQHDMLAIEPGVI
jgi:hypothetical protein